MVSTQIRPIHETQMSDFMDAVCAFNFYSNINTFKNLFGQYRADDIQEYAKRYGYDSMVKGKLSPTEKAAFLGYISQLLASGQNYDDYCQLVQADN